MTSPLTANTNTATAAAGGGGGSCHTNQAGGR